MDPGQDETEKLIKKTAKKIKEHYGTAQKELEAKLQTEWKATIAKEKVKRAMLEAGEISKEEYAQWLKGQIMTGNRWKSMLEAVSQSLDDYQEAARAIVNGELPTAYAMGHNYGTYSIERQLRASTSYTLYDANTVTRLLKDDPELLPALKQKSKTAREIAAGKINKWHKRQITSVCMQGVVQGESVPKIATRISNITNQDAKATIRYARTMTTGAENAGRVDSYKRAQDMGIETKQQWLATLDERTRESHREMDGEIVEVGEKFSNDCEFPGDSGGPAEEIWNCRCTLIPVLTGISELESDNDVTNAELRNTDHMAEGGYNSYDEWKKGHMKSHRITEQKEKGENIKNAWVSKYRKAAKRLGV